MKKNILVLYVISIFAFLILVNHVDAANGVILDKKIAGEQTIIVNGKSFKGSLYSQISYMSDGQTKTAQVNRLLIDQSTLESIIKEFVNNDSNYSVEINGLTHKVEVNYNCKDDLYTTVTMAINFNSYSLSTSAYRRTPGNANSKLESSSPDYKEKSISTMKGGDANNPDLFYVDGKYSVRGLAEALKATTDWRNGVTKINYPYLLTDLPKYCNWGI